MGKPVSRTLCATWCFIWTDSDGRAISRMSLVGWDPEHQSHCILHPFGSSGGHSKVRLSPYGNTGQLEGLGDEEIPVVTGALSGEVGSGKLFGSPNTQYSTYLIANPYATRTQGKEQVTPQGIEPDLPMRVQESPEMCGSVSPGCRAGGSE